MRFHKHAALLQKFLKSTEERLTEVAKAGGEVPGYKLVRALSNRQWAADDEEIAKRLKSRKLKKADIYESKIKSPAKIEKILSDPKFFEKYVTREEKGLKLVEEKDKRPAVEIQSAAEQFND